MERISTFMFAFSFSAPLSWKPSAVVMISAHRSLGKSEAVSPFEGEYERWKTQRSELFMLVKMPSMARSKGEVEGWWIVRMLNSRSFTKSPRGAVKRMLRRWPDDSDSLAPERGICS